VRVSELRDLGGYDRFTFYEHTKPYLANPPDAHRLADTVTNPVNLFGVLICKSGPPTTRAGRQGQWCEWLRDLSRDASAR